jgi:hypothetical protein
MRRAINGEGDGKNFTSMVRLKGSMAVHELGGGCCPAMVRLHHVIIEPCRKRNKLNAANVNR